MELNIVTDDVLAAIIAVDTSRTPFKSFQPGVGPYGEPQLLKMVATHLNGLPQYLNGVCTRRVPDLLITGKWAFEFKIARPFGDNGNEAENWSVNLLHPYRGNVSSIGDCFKLLDLQGIERKAVAVIGYEHNPARIDLTPLVNSFEVIARDVARVSFSQRVERRHTGLIHPVHQVLRLFTWEVLGRNA